ncbi:MAG: orotate phosphoribosyltransferase [Thermosulfidibacteraceae bacterium]|jgi:orotate phosphoribosyltransferase
MERSRTTNFKERLKELLVEKSFLYSREPKFKLVSGMISNYYINCKPVTMDPEGLYLIGNIVFEMIKDLKVDAIGGLTMGADPIAYAVSYTSYLKGHPIKVFVVRKEEKDHGTRKLVEGDLKEGDKVVIVEDVITTGSSTLKAYRALSNLGVDIIGVVSIVIRPEEKSEEFINLRLPVWSIFGVEELKEAYLRRKGG